MDPAGEPAAVILHAMKNDLLVAQQSLQLARREGGSTALLGNAETAMARVVSNLWKLIDVLWPEKR